jgi:iron-regulated transporter 1
LAQLLVSLLTTAGSYEFTLWFYLGFTVLSTVFEYVWIEIVYKAFPVLAEEEAERQVRILAHRERQKAAGRRTVSQLVDAGKESMRQMGRDWADFARQPIFLSQSWLTLERAPR